MTFRANRRAGNVTADVLHRRSAMGTQGAAARQAANSSTSLPLATRTRTPWRIIATNGGTLFVCEPLRCNDEPSATIQHGRNQRSLTRFITQWPKAQDRCWPEPIPRAPWSPRIGSGQPSSQSTATWRNRHNSSRQVTPFAVVDSWSSTALWSRLAI